MGTLLPTYEALIERYGVLDRPAGRDLQSLVGLIAQICGVPHAAINIMSSTQQHQVVAHGFEASVCAREDSMCAVLMDETRPVVVSDATVDPRFSANPFVSGELGTIRFYASAPITTAEGVAIGRLCVFDDTPRDLTALQRQALKVMASQVTDLLELRYRSQALEDSLRDLTTVRDKLRRSNEHLTQFAGQVSHDLRTPLTAILVNAELLAGEPVVQGDPHASEMVTGINEAGRRMDAMIAEMLDFAREGGRLRLVDTDLSAVVHSVLGDIDPLIRQSEADVQVGHLPRVLGDADLLYSVVLNLLTNAIKFARPNERSVVAITADRVQHHWRVRVTDNGIGVSQERRQAMFELFAREDGTASGHGIGLATAKRIVEAHGGTIGMESATGGGTSVWFDLPG
ncbi:histidine kinase [Aeromicrobium chenweiae]|uniref:Sensor-like histidine kinase SenX3 n=1 Tax=Aeromicrobium chenweiae TaxID=2079793 RepID=A0A2S0WIM0_9ACTN|nr:histidine kinase [Aeromicrobium chenweiae]TGN31692.1 GAF domain-containing sensor histidine kinase [Aeromicrobium chenweiae]